MKRLILILAITALVGCSKDEDVKPSGSTSENVEQYVGTWNFNVQNCTNKTISIQLGTQENELIFDGMRGIVKDKTLRVSNPVDSWVVDFVSDKFAMANYNFGSCVGNLNKR